MDSIAHPGFAPISLAIPGGISPNRCIVIDGEVPKQAKSARLQCGQSIKEKEDIAMSVRFFFDNNATTFSVNSYLLNEWGTPEGSQQKEEEKAKKEVQAKPSTEVLLRPGDRCNLVLECHDTDFSIHVQSRHLYDYVHRTDYAHISYLVVTDDFLVNQVGVVGGDGPMRWIVHEHVQDTWEPPITTLTDNNFATSILNSSVMWLVLFYSHPAGSVRAPWIQAARHNDVRDIRFGVLDSLVNLDTVSLLGIRTCPTILHFPQGIKTPQTFEKYSGEYSARGFVQWALHRYRREPGQPPGFGSPLPPDSHPVHLVRTLRENSLRFDTEREFGEVSIWHDWARRDGRVVVDKAVGDDVEEDLVAIINIDQQGEKTFQELITKKSNEKKSQSVNKMVRDNVIISIAGPKAIEVIELTEKEKEAVGKELDENDSNETDLTENELPEKELATLTAKERAELLEQGVSATGALIDQALAVEEKNKPKALKFDEKAIEVDTQENVEVGQENQDYKIVAAPKEFVKKLLGSNVEINRQKEDEMRRFKSQQEGRVSQKDSKGTKPNSSVASGSAIGGLNKNIAAEDKKKLEISKQEKADENMAAAAIKSPSGAQKVKQKDIIGQKELLDKLIERLSKPDPPKEQNQATANQDLIKIIRELPKSQSRVSSGKVSKEPSKISQEGTKKTKTQEGSLKTSRKTSKTSIKHSPKESLKTLPKDARDQRGAQPVSSFTKIPDKPEEQAGPNVQQGIFSQIMKRLTTPDPAKVTQDLAKVTQGRPIVIEDEPKRKPTREGSKVSERPSKTSIKPSTKGSLKMLPPKDSNHRGSQTLASLTRILDNPEQAGAKITDKDEKSGVDVQQGVLEQVAQRLSRQGSAKDTKEAVKITPEQEKDTNEQAKVTQSIHKINQQASERLSRQGSAKDTKEAVKITPEQAKITQEQVKITKSLDKISPQVPERLSRQGSAKDSKETVKITPEQAKVTNQDTAKITEDTAKTNQDTAKDNQNTENTTEDAANIAENAAKINQNTAKVMDNLATKVLKKSQKSDESLITSRKTSKTSVKISPRASLKTPPKDLKDQQTMKTLAAIAKLPGEISQKITNLVGRASVKESIKSLSQKEENYADITQKLTNTKPINIIDANDGATDVIAHSRTNSKTLLTKSNAILSLKEEKILDLPVANLTVATAGKGGTKPSPKVSKTDLSEKFTGSAKISPKTSKKDLAEEGKVTTAKRISEKSSGIMKSPKTSATNVHKDQKEGSRDESIQNVSSTKSTNLTDENNSLKTNVQLAKQDADNLAVTPSQTEKKEVKMDKVSTKSSIKRLPQREEKVPQITQKASNVKFVEANSEREIAYKTNKTQSGSTVKLFQGEGSTAEPSQMQIEPSKNLILSQSKGKLIKEPQGSEERMSKGSASDPGEIYEEVELGSEQALERSFFASMMSMEWADRMHYAASDIRRLVHYSGCNYL